MNDQTEAESAAARAAQEEQARADLQARAVDESDPRVAKHLETAGAQATVTAEENARREKALADAKLRIEDNAAKIASMRDALKTAGDALAAAVAERDALTEAFSKLELPVPASPAAQLAPKEATTLMFFPRLLQIIHNGAAAVFPQGIHPVPESVASHWWLTANGVRPFAGTLPEPEPKTEPAAKAA